MTNSILDKISGPEDLRNLTEKDLYLLASEIRSRIVTVVSRNGGHLASNLGVVELSIALHRVFHTPEDSIVWDVGHQCYAHKMLSGRTSSFETLRLEGGLSGFPKRSESPHDVFETGHASTSISAALGLLAADRLSGGDHSAIAVIGDGALTGGMAYEALCHAGELQLPLIVILNDNKMSIGPNEGALSKYLSRLTMKSRYQVFRRTVDHYVQKIPFIGGKLFSLIVRIKRGVKALFFIENLFVDLGFEYVGPIQGHKILFIERVLEDVRRLKKPVVVHLLTRKGKGYEFAEEDPSSFHGVSSFSVDDGLFSGKSSFGFTDAFGKAISDLAREDSRLVAITAAMEKGTGLAPFHAAFPERFFDVGIAEQHAMTFAAGLAAGGRRPVVALYSTFAQRSVDQVIHDIAIQNLPVILSMDRAGLVPGDGETHQGLFDIALFRSVPNLTILAPASALELAAMLRWAIEASRPVLLRYPKTSCPAEIPAFCAPIANGRGCFTREGDGSVLIAYTGSLYPEVSLAGDLLAASGVTADLYNLRFLKPVDEDYLAGVLSRYSLIALAEEGMAEGGFGEYLAALIADRSLEVSLVRIGTPSLFPAQGSRSQLLSRLGLDGRGIAASVTHALTEMEKRNG